MADNLSININVEQAKDALNQLRASFSAMSTTAAATVGTAATAINRLNKALAAVKPIDAGILNSVNTLSQGMSGLNSINLSGLTGTISALTAQVSQLGALATNLQNVANSANGISAAAGAMQSAATAANGLGAAGNAARTAFTGAGAGATQAQNAIKSLGVELLNAGGYMLGLGVSVGNVVGRFTELKTAGIGTTGIIGGLVTQFGALGGAAVIVAAAAAGFTLLYSAASAVVGPIIEIGTAFNNFKIAIDAIDGAGAGARTFEQLVGVANRTAQSLTTLSKTYLGFRAATESAGVSAAQSMKIFEQMNIGLRALGKDSVATEKAMQALTQMFSKGKVQAEELRGQLGDTLPGALTYAAQAMKITTAELDAMMKAGAVLATDLIPKLGEFLEIKFGEAIAKQVASATGQIGLFQTAIALLQNAVANGLGGGVLGGFAAGLASINNALNSEALKAFAAVIGDLMGMLLAATGGAIGGFVQGLTFIYDVAARLAGGFVALISPLNGLLSSLTSSNSIMSSVSTVMGVLGGLLGVGVSAWTAYRLAIIASGVALAGFNAASAMMSGSVGGMISVLNSAKGAFLGTFMMASLQATTASAAITSGMNAAKTAVLGFSASAAIAQAQTMAKAVAMGVLSAATTVYAAVAGTAATAVKLLGMAFEFLGKNPLMAAGFGVLVASLTVLIPMAYDAVTAFGGWRGAVDALVGSNAQLASTSQVVSASLKSFLDEVNKTPESVMKVANSYFSLEEAQKRAKNELDILDFKLSDVKSAMDAHSASVKGMEASERGHARSTQESIQGLEAQRNALSSSARATKEMGLSADSSKGQIADLNDQIRNMKESLQDSNLAHQDRMESESRFRDALQQTADAYESNKAAIQMWGVALDEPSQAMARQLVMLGQTKEQATGLVHGYQSLTQTSTEFANSLNNGADKLEAQSLLFAKMVTDLNAAKEARLASMSADERGSAVGKALTEQYTTQVSKLQELIGSNVKNAASMRTAADVSIGLGTASERAGVHAEELGRKFGVAVDPIETVGRSIEKLSGEMDKTGSSAESASTGADNLKTSAQGSGEQLKKAGDAAGTASANIEKMGTVLATTKDKFDVAKVSLEAISGALNVAGVGAAAMANNLPSATEAVAALGEAAPVTNGTVAPLADSIKKIGEGAGDITAKLPAVATAMGELATAALPASAPLQVIGDAMFNIANSAEGMKKTQDAFTEFVKAIGQSKADVETATENLMAMRTAAEGVASSFYTATTGGENFVNSFDSLNSGLDNVIARMNSLKEAAEAAFKMAQKAAGAESANSSSSSSSETPAQRQGGYAGDRLESQRIDMSKFSGAPHFAEGTANTNKYLSKVSGGGIPSILHPNEAVIPLSKGRKIPVDLNMSMQSAPTQDLGVSSGLDSLAKSIGVLANAASDLSSVSLPSMDLTLPTFEPIVNVNVEAGTTTLDAPLMPPQARQSSDGLLGERIPASDTSGGRDRDRSTKDSGKPGNTTININVQASDVDSFNRSKDQIYRDLKKSINKADRRSRS